MSNPAPNYKISGSIYATNARAEHEMKGQKFTVDSTGELTMDAAGAARLQSTAGGLVLKSHLDMNVESVAGDLKVMSTDATKKMILGVRDNTNMKTATEINSNSNTRLLTGSGYTAGTRQALYYADGSGDLKMLEGTTSTDGVKQILSISHGDGTLSWVDAEAASLKCLGMTSTYQDASFPRSTDNDVVSHSSYTTGKVLILGAVDPVNDTSVFTRVPKQEALTIASTTSQRTVTGGSKLFDAPTTSIAYSYFRAHQSGQYHVSVQGDFFNQFYDGGWESDVSGDRTLEILKYTTTDAEFDDVNNLLMIDESDTDLGSSATVIQTVTKQPNPDSEIPTPINLSFSYNANQGDVLIVRFRANIDVNSAFVQAMLRKFDVHYICD